MILAENKRSWKAKRRWRRTGMSYPHRDVPSWCEMPVELHSDGMQGCWGISYGQVEETGESHCVNCDCHKNNIAEAVL